MDSIISRTLSQMGQRRIGGRSVDPNVYGNDLVDRLSTMADSRKGRTADISPILTGMNMRTTVPVGYEDTASEGGEYEYGAPKMGTAEYDEYTKDNPSPPVFDYLANNLLAPAMTYGAKIGANAALPVVGPLLVDVAKEGYKVSEGKLWGKAATDFAKNTILGYATGQTTKGIDFGKNTFFNTIGKGIANTVGKSVLGKAWKQFTSLFGDDDNDILDNDLIGLSGYIGPFNAGANLSGPKDNNTIGNIFDDPAIAMAPSDGGDTEADTPGELWEGDSESGMYGGAYDYGDTGWEGDSESGMYGGAYD